MKTMYNISFNNYRLIVACKFNFSLIIYFNDYFRWRLYALVIIALLILYKYMNATKRYVILLLRSLNVKALIK